MSPMLSGGGGGDAACDRNIQQQGRDGTGIIVGDRPLNREEVCVSPGINYSWTYTYLFQVDQF